MLSQERIKFLFTYENGKLIRNFTIGKAFVGTSCLTTDKDGYLVVGIDKKLYKAHRVIWLYVNGKFPNGPIDHINRIKNDNRIENLREINHSKNMQNIAAKKTNKCGIKGVCMHKKSGKWNAQIEANGKHYNLGFFSSIDEAAQAYKEAATKYHTHNSIIFG